MQQMMGIPRTATPSPVPATGPGEESSTVNTNHHGTAPAAALVTIAITHNEVVITATLAMGREGTVMQRWERRRGKGKGWWRVEGAPSLRASGSAVSPELAAWLDRIAFPYEVANMLPGAATPAAQAAIAAAAKEVANV